MSLVSHLTSLLAHPLTRGFDLDDPRTTALRRQIIAGKPCLRRIYQEWYRALAGELSAGRPERTGEQSSTRAGESGGGDVLELGSGAGFIEDAIPGAIKSDVFVCPGIDLVLDGQKLPFADGALSAIVMTNVLHHIPQPRLFIAEAARCVYPGGVVAMIEPWVNHWSTWVYRHLHHEPFAPDAAWEIDAAGPLSGANGALPWILFHRDRARFEADFPLWRIRAIRPLMPLRYLLSGGVSLRNLLPGPLDRPVAALEALCPKLGMFALICLERQPAPGPLRQEE